MTEARNVGVNQQQSPARRRSIGCGRTPKSMEDVDKRHDECGDENASHKRMRKAAMVGETEIVSAKAADDVKIRRFGGKRERQRGIGSLAVESGAAQVRAEEEMGYGFQGS